MPKRRKSVSRTRSGRSRRDNKYSHPVPEPGLIVQTLEDQGVPVSFDQLVEILGLSGDRLLGAFRRQLKRMASSGQLLVNRKGEYCLLEKIDGITGQVSAHADGYGFLMPDDGSNDVYIPFQEMRQLLDGDRVVVRIAGTGRGGRPAGTVVEILERGKQFAVGRYQREHGIGFVVEAGRSPHHFVVPDHHRGKAQAGQVVKLQITEFPNKHREAQGKITKILGEPTDPGIAAEIAIEQFALPSSWSGAVLKAAERLGDRVRPADKQDREDLRDLPLVTIDGADARDFDDAVYAESDGDGWRLIVAIADVSHYVRPEEALDLEARRRGTSVYFPDRVVPMLPESLSNGLCSLNPEVDRLCMACDMQISRSGKVTRSRFYRAIMRSAARLTYEAVDRMHGQPGHKLSRKNINILQQITVLYDVYRVLIAARRKRGALDLDLPEVKIELNSTGAIERMAPRLRTDAHRLIEECMIAANVQAGKFLLRHRLPTLYRVHEGPGEERFEALRLLLQQLGIKVTDQARSDPRQLNGVLREIGKRPDHHVLNFAVLRSLSQAVYQPANNGHFGLALDTYAHFTSPIRRYPDLLVHRGIGHLLDSGKPGAFYADIPAMEQAGKLCSTLERRAEEAERHVEARYKCAYMLDRVGEVLDGTVTGVTHFGLFVTLKELFIEGLIHVTALNNDYYHCEHGGLRLTGERTGASFGLGDTVTVRIVRVDVDEAKLDLALVENESEARSSDRRRRSARRRHR